MKKSIIMLILAFIYSCKPDSKKELHTGQEEELITKTIKSTELAEIGIDTILETKDSLVKIDSSTNQIEFSIEYIKFKTSNLSIEISVDFDREKTNNFIPEEFVSKFITPHKIGIGYPEHLHPDYPEAYSFQEFKEFSEFDLFTFTYDDESCCRTLYAVTTKKDSLEVINIGVIGYTGGDGGWVGEQYGKWINDTTIETTIVSDYDGDLIDNNNSEIDTTWTVIKLSQNGYLKELRVDSVKYIGNKKIE